MDILFYLYKFFGWLFNFFVVVIGALLLAAGIYATSETSAFSSQLSVTSIITQPAIMFIVLGVFLVIIGSIGVLGTLREIRVLLWVYVGVVGVILVLEIALVGYLAFSFTQNKDQFRDQVNKAFNPFIENYRDDDDLRALVDLLQEGLVCCGVITYEVWNENRYFNCSAPGVEKCGVPNSCCKADLRINSQCGYNVRDPSDASRLGNINLKPCLQAFQDFLVANQIALAVLAGVLLLIQVAAVVVSLLLSFEIPNKRESDAMKKLQDNREEQAEHKRGKHHARSQ